MYACKVYAHVCRAQQRHQAMATGNFQSNIICHSSLRSLLLVTLGVGYMQKSL